MNLVINLVLIIFLLVLSIQDIREKRIKLLTLILFLAFALVIRIVLCIENKGTLQDDVVLLLPGLLMLAIAQATRESIGKGDGLVILAIGMLAGFNRTVEILIFAMALSAMIALVCVAIKKVSGKYELPFIPSLLLATIIVVWSSDMLFLN